MVSTDDLKTERETINEARGNRNGRIAREIGRDGKSSVVTDRPIEAVRGNQIDVTHCGRHGSRRGEGNVGVRRGEHEIRAFEDVGHLFIDVNAEHLGGSGDLKVESGRGHLHSDLNLYRQVVVTGGVEVTQGASKSNQVRERPFKSTVGKGKCELNSL